MSNDRIETSIRDDDNTEKEPQINFVSVFKKLHPPHCESKDVSNCIGPTGWQTAFLLSGFGLLIIGAAGIRPCNLAFRADQFNPNTECDKRGVNSCFNWYFSLKWCSRRSSFTRNPT
ncbi:hypothetical protein HAX54_047046 [Datura stramonium]|uniref:Uncharacterized protein n=1 Tax=Datura stramonium TaxID=4076 RepID=A0ABS8SSD6_DATST|nr:hypothetical protein [Datura stramonium]